MCGIVGYVGPDEALPIVMEGLRRLEYRGYDSAGIAVVDGGLTVRKRAGKLAELEALLVDRAGPAGDDRDRSHSLGDPRRADGRQRPPPPRLRRPGGRDPQRDHRELPGAARPAGQGGPRLRVGNRHGVRRAPAGGEAGAMPVRWPRRCGSAVGELEGSYALVVLSSNHPDELVGVKVSSPLVVAMWDDGEAMLASDIPALLGTHHADRPTIAPVDEGWIVSLTRDGVAAMDLDGADVPLQPIEVDWNVAQAQKGGYPYFMRKEIDEQPAAIRDTLAGRVHAGGLQLDELRVPDDVLREVSKVFVVACGTAFHSGLVAKYAIEHWTRLPVEIEIASEFRYRDPVLGPDTLTLAVSQSGETIDTLEAARHAARQGSQVLAVTNTVGSSLAREADGVFYTHAGPEIGVAASKTFSTQMVAQELVALYLAQVRAAKFPEEIAEVLADLDELPPRSHARSRRKTACARSRNDSRTRATCSSSGATPAIRLRSRARSS